MPEELSRGEPKAVRQLPLGTVLPRIQRGPRCPGRTCVPRLMRRQFGEEESREPRLYVLAFCAEADCVLSGWLRLEVDAPAHVEVATYEWPGHGVREAEPLLTTLDELGADAFEAFREPMQTGHFICCGCSVGVLVMVHVCERAQRELGVVPRSCFALDRGPPHLPVFTEEGARLLRAQPEEWLRLWSPGIHRLHREGKIGGAAFRRWVADMQVENDTRPVGWYHFPCRMNAVVALGTTREFPPPAARSEGVGEEWADRRARCTRSGKGYSFEPEEYDLWRCWADDVRIYELPCEHESTQRDPGFQSLLWSEAKRVLDAAS